MRKKLQKYEKNENGNMFLCEVCGNPLIKSKKQQIRCIYCKQIVDVPQNTCKKKAGVR